MAIREGFAVLVIASILAWGTTTLLLEPKPSLAKKADPRGPLTMKEKRRTKRIVAQHPLFKALVAGHAYRYELTIPWGAYDEKRKTERRVGSYSWVSVTPTVPLFTAVWPLVCYPKHGSRSYVRWHARFTVHDLRKIAINVDLRKGKLVQLVPEDASSLDYPPGLESPCGPSEPD